LALKDQWVLRELLVLKVHYQLQQHQLSIQILGQQDKRVQLLVMQQMKPIQPKTLESMPLILGIIHRLFGKLEHLVMETMMVDGTQIGLI
jgi:hypothetical protein